MCNGVYVLSIIDTNSYDMIAVYCFNDKAKSVKRAIDDYRELFNEDLNMGIFTPDISQDLAVNLTEYEEYPLPYHDVYYYINFCKIN